MILLTTKQAAKILDVNDSRVRQFILQGRLPAKKFGFMWMIEEKDLDLVKDRKPGKPKKNSQATQCTGKRNDPNSLPVSKQTGGK